MGIVDRYSRKLLPTALDDLGLMPALRSLSHAFSKQTRIAVELDIFPGVERLNTEKKTSFYHIIEEALAQVTRQTHASQVSITIKKSDLGARMQYVDNGASINTSNRSRIKERKSLALLGMKERMEMVGGSFAVESIKGVGTTITACIPFGKSPLRKRNDTKSASIDP
jgi:signal transduction histidine kinase